MTWSIIETTDEPISQYYQKNKASLHSQKIYDLYYYIPYDCYFRATKQVKKMVLM